MQEERQAVRGMNEEIANIRRRVEVANMHRAARADAQRAEVRDPLAARLHQMSAARMARYEERRANGGAFPPRPNDDEVGPSRRNGGDA